MSNKFELSIKSQHYPQERVNSVYTNERRVTESAEERLSRIQELEDRLRFEDEERRRFSDDFVQLGASLERGAGNLIAGMGTLGHIAETKVRGLVGANTNVAPNALIRGGERLLERADEIEAQTSGMYREMMDQSTPSGDLTDPSSISLGENPTFGGLLRQAVFSGLEELPTYAAIAATTVATRNPNAGAAMLAGRGAKGAAAVTAVGGVTSAASSAGNQAYENVRKLESFNNTELFEQSAPFRERASASIKERLEPAIQEAELELGPLSDTEKARIAEAVIEDSLDEARTALASDVRTESGGLGAVSGLAGGMALGKIFGPVMGRTTQSYVRQVAGKIGASIAVEGTQEVFEGVGGRIGFQNATGIETNLTENTFAEFALGAGAGATMSGPTAILTTQQEESPEALKAQAESRNEQVIKARSKLDALARVEEKGDYSELLDRNSETYDPALAMADVRTRVSTAEGLTPEQLNEGAQLIDSIYGELESYTAYLQQRVAAYDQKQHIEAKLNQVEAEIEAGNLNDVEMAEAVEARQVFESKREQFEQMEREVEEFGGIEKMRQTVDAQQAELQLTGNIRDEVTKRGVQNINIPELQEQIGYTRDAINQQLNPEKAKEVVVLAMANPTAFDNEGGQELLAAIESSDSIDAETKTAFSEYRRLRADIVKQAESKSTAQVNADIISGDKKGKFLGIRNYMDQIPMALALGNRGNALQRMELLSKFTQDHSNKADQLAAAVSAFQEASSTSSKSKKFHIAPLGDGTWEMREGHVDNKTRAQTGSINVDRKTGIKLLPTIQREAELLQRASSVLSGVITGTTSTEVLHKSQQEIKTGAAIIRRNADNQQVAPVQEREQAREEITTEEGSVESPTITTAPTPINTPTLETTSTPAPSTSTPTSTASVETTPTSATETVTQEAEPTQEEQTTEEPISFVEEVTRNTEEGPVQQLRDTPVNKLLPRLIKESAAVAESGLRKFKDFFNQMRTMPEERVQGFQEYLREKLKGVNTEDSAFDANLFILGKQLETIKRDFVYPIMDSYVSRYNADNTLNPNIQALHPIVTNTLEDGSLEYNEDFANALALSAQGWIMQNGFMGLKNNEDSLRALLNIDDDVQIREHLQKISEDAALILDGTILDNLVTEMGAQVSRTYGLRLSEDTPVNISVLVEQHMGTMLVGVLQDMNVLARRQASITTENSETGKKAQSKLSVITLSDEMMAAQKADPQTRISDGIAGFVSTAVMNRNFTESLFTTTTERPAPSKTANKFSQPKVKNSVMSVPRVLSKLLDKLQSKKHFLDESAFDTWSVLDDNYEVLEQNSMALIMGYKSEAELSKLTKHNRISAIDINKQIANEIQEIRAAREQYVKGEPFYYDRFMAKQQRVHYKNSFNPQESKVARAFIRMEGWNNTVSETNLDSFYLAVGEAFGIKTDSQSNNDSVAAAKEMVNRARMLIQGDYTNEADPFNDPFVKGVEEMAKVVRDSNYQANGQGIKAFMDDAGEGFHSYAGLLHMVRAAYHMEENSGDLTGFEHSLWREVDGKTNGPMLGLLNLAGQGNLVDAMQAGGFFTKQSGLTSLSEYVSNGGKDLYEKIAAMLPAKLSDHVAHNKNKRKFAKNKQMDRAVKHFFGEIAEVSPQTGELVANKKGRKFAKPITTQKFYGSGIKSLMEGMVEDVMIPSITSKIEQEVQDLNTAVMSGSLEQQNQARLALAQSLEMLKNIANFPKSKDLPGKIRFLNNTNRRIKKNEINTIAESTLDLVEFKGGTLLSLESNFNDYMGKPTKDLFEEYLFKFQARAETVNTASNTMFSIYKRTFEQLAEQKLNEKVEKGERVKTKGDVRYLLSKKELEAIKKQLESLMPWVHSALSAQNNDKAGALAIGKFEPVIKEGRPFASSVRLRNINRGPGNTKKENAYALSKGTLLEMQEPGVATVINMIHAMDSAIAHSVGIDDKYSLLNVHDAKIGSAEQATKFGKALNKATFDVLARYSIPVEILNSYTRSMTNYIKMIDNAAKSGDQQLVKTLLNSAREAFAQDLGTMAPVQTANGTELQTFSGVLRTLTAQARTATLEKLRYMRDVVYVDQYTINEGAYQPTAEDRKRIDAEIEKVSNIRLNIGLMKQLQKLEDSLNITRAKKELAVDGYMDREAKRKQTSAISQLISESYENTDPAEAQRVVDEVAQTVTAEFGERAENSVISTKLASINNGIHTVSSVLSVMQNNLKQSLEYPAQKQIAEYLNKAGKTSNLSNVPVLMISEDNKEGARSFLKNDIGLSDENIDAFFNGDVNAQYLVTDGNLRGSTKEIIVIKASGFVNNNGTTHNFNNEQFLHETYHAIVAGWIAKEEQKSPEKRTVNFKRLEVVFEVAKGKFGHIKELAPAFENMQEFVAWGMTNPTLQKHLQSVSVEEGFSQFKNDPNKNALLKLPKKTWERSKNLFQEFTRFLMDFLGYRKNKNQQTLLTTFLFSASRIENSRRNPRAFLLSAKRSNKVAELSMSNQPTGTQDILNLDSEQVFDALVSPNDSESFNKGLRQLLTDVTDKVLGKAGTMAEVARLGAALRPEDVYTKSIQEGKLPFASYAKGNPVLGITDQQALVLDQVEAVLATSLINSHATYKSLVNIFNKTEKAVQDSDFYQGDWNKASVAERNKAAKIREAVFSREAHPDSNYLARFAALALTNPKVSAALQSKQVGRDPLGDTESVGGMLNLIWNTSTNLLMGDMDKTDSKKNVKDNIQTLLENLVNIQSASKNSLIERSSDFIGYAEDAVDAEINKLGTKLPDLMDAAHGKVRNWNPSKGRGFIKATAAFGKLAAHGEIGNAVTDLMASRRLGKNRGTKANLLESIVSEVRGAHDAMSKLTHKLVRYAKRNEHERMTKANAARKNLLEGFANKGEYLTKEAKDSITRGLIRNDAQSLMETYDTHEMERLFKDNEFLNSELQKIRNHLSQFDNYNEYLVAVKDLAQYKATEEVKSAFLLINAKQIANLHGTGLTVNTEQANRAERAIDILVTLETINYMDNTDREAVSAILEVENARSDGENGITRVLQYHREEQEKAKNLEYGGDTLLMEKGYTVDILNDKKIAVKATEKEGKRLEKMGYVKGPRVTNDPEDSFNDVQYLYSFRNGGMNRLVTGALSYTSTTTPRAERVNKAFNLDDGLDSLKKERKLMQEIRDKKVTKFLEAAKQGESYDPTVGVEGQMIPLFDSQGNVASFHYVNGREARDNLLDRNNSFDEVLSKMVAQHFDREASTEQNRNVVKALKEAYDAETNKFDFSRSASNYVYVGLDSTDPEHRELYRILSEDTRNEISRVWGQPGMYVRNDVLDNIFGYRKYTLASSIGKERAQKNLMEKSYSMVFETVFGDKAALRGAQWAELVDGTVKHIRDMAVVKNLFTLALNITSNASQLVLAGLSTKQAFQLQREALTNALAYRRDSAELEELRQIEELGIIGDTAKNRIKELENSLKNNKAAKLIQEGLMPTVVEDVDMVNDPFAYKSLAEERIEQVTDRLPSWLTTVGKNVYMTHDTKLYKFMAGAAQLSDFTARYALYEYNTQYKDSEKMGHNEAIQESSETFINYDLPTHKAVQWLNDVGLMFYTKYYWRVQRVLYKNLKEKPAKALSMAAAESYFNNLGSVMGSSVHEAYGNPIQESILKYPGAVQNTMVIRGLRGILD